VISLILPSDAVKEANPREAAASDDDVK